MSQLPDLPEDQKKMFLEQAPGPTKAILRFIEESKTRELKTFEVKAYERTLASLVGSVKAPNDENILDQKLSTLKARRQVLYVYSKKLKKNIAIVPESNWRDVKEGYEIWTVDETTLMMSSGVDIGTVDLIRKSLDGEVISEKEAG